MTSDPKDEERRDTKEFLTADLNRLRRASNQPPPKKTLEMPTDQLFELLTEMDIEGQIEEVRQRREAMDNEKAFKKKPND